MDVERYDGPRAAVRWLSELAESSAALPDGCPQRSGASKTSIA
ncbi:hypothetical protein [Dactylosporangium roseum]|nr:hypothetical protein [Dactylosporangium roseum]